MKIAITGATGFVGSHLSNVLKADGHDIVVLGRKECAMPTNMLAASMEGCEALFNLAGETINRRWTKEYKKRILSSRLDTTRNLVDAMQLMATPPATFISTSAIGAFAQEGCYTEHDTANASDFLGQLSMDWEHAALRADSIGVRTLIFRFGLVLGQNGGLIKQVLFPFKLGLGGPVGDGTQSFSWVHIDDLAAAYTYAIQNPAMAGVFHICAPNPSSNLEFSRMLGKALNRPAFLPVPVWVLKLIFGEGAEVMSSGQTVISERLPAAGFEFRYPQLQEAIAEVVNSKA